MKLILFCSLCIFFLPFTACGDLIHDTENHTSQFYETSVLTESEIATDSDTNNENDSGTQIPAPVLNLEETSLLLEEFLGLQFNSEEGALDINFPIGDPDVTIQSTKPCVSLAGDTEVTYVMGEVSWDAALKVTLTDCVPETNESSTLNSTFDLFLHGPFGSVTSYNLVGTVSAEGPVAGDVAFNIFYSVSDCLFKWDCWSGEANGYGFSDEIKPLLSI